MNLNTEMYYTIKALQTIGYIVKNPYNCDKVCKVTENKIQKIKNNKKFYSHFNPKEMAKHLNLNQANEEIIDFWT